MASAKFARHAQLSHLLWAYRLARRSHWRPRASRKSHNGQHATRSGTLRTRPTGFSIAKPPYAVTKMVRSGCASNKSPSRLQVLVDSELRRGQPVDWNALDASLQTSNERLASRCAQVLAQADAPKLDRPLQYEAPHQTFERCPGSVGAGNYLYGASTVLYYHGDPS
jgi:hypothetical protein